MEEEFQNLLGFDHSSNCELLMEHILGIDKHVRPYFDVGKPFFKGTFDFQYFNYLKDKNLNYESLSPEDVFAYIAPLFQNMPNWANPGTMLNIIPHVNIASLAVAAYASLLNANFSQDRYAGLLLTAELEVIKYISELVGWNWKGAHGFFTFGGKGTNLYATKIAMNRAFPTGQKDGYSGKQLFLITSQKGHPCHKEVADWLGIGSGNCISVACDDNGEIHLDEAQHVICKNIEEGKIFLGFNLTGGSTVEFEVDPIKKVATLRDFIKDKYNLNYTPLIHVDSVIVWAWLFFRDYDFYKNPLNIESRILNKIKNLYNRISELKYADSFGVDFHKSGFCPAVSSLFIAKDRADIYLLGGKESIKVEDLRFGNYSPFESSLELSRSSWGAVSALVSLKSFGIKGFQKAIVHLMTFSDFFKKELNKLSYIEVINPESLGLATLFVMKPKEYESLNLSEILTLPFNDTEKIKEYNLSYALYVNELNKSGKISFTLTASDAFNVKNTKVCLGSQKAYPMSLFVTTEDIIRIISEIQETKFNFDLAGPKHLSKINNSPVDMVYRK